MENLYKSKKRNNVGSQEEIPKFQKKMVIFMYMDIKFLQ